MTDMENLRATLFGIVVAVTLFAWYYIAELRHDDDDPDGQR